MLQAPLLHHQATKPNANKKLKFVGKSYSSPSCTCAKEISYKNCLSFRPSYIYSFLGKMSDDDVEAAKGGTTNNSFACPWTVPAQPQCFIDFGASELESLITTIHFLPPPCHCSKTGNAHEESQKCAALLRLPMNIIFGYKVF